MVVNLIKYNKKIRHQRFAQAVWFSPLSTGHPALKFVNFSGLKILIAILQILLSEHPGHERVKKILNIVYHLDERACMSIVARADAKW